MGKKEKAKNMLAIRVLMLNECLLVWHLVLFGIIIITYFPALFQRLKILIIHGVS